MKRERFTAVGPVLALAAVVAGCRPSDDVLNKVYLCDHNVPHYDCGSSPSGSPFTCTDVTASLQGKDFCAEPCAEGPNVVTETYACLQDGSRVARCRPSLGAQACADSAVSCFRTDLEQDDGLCLPIATCSSDSACSSTLNTCASSIVPSLYPQAPGLKMDSLNCMTTGCYANKKSCLPGQQCLYDAIGGPSPDFPDVCLPTCDPNGWSCPPDYSCLKRLGPTYPDLCAPGLLGKPCGSDLDCMIGHCVDVEYGYKVCSRDCTTDADCIPFDNGPTYFFCANNQCISPESLLWPSCSSDADCPDPRLICAHPHPDDPNGACRFPCAADGSCAARAGIIHGCHVWSGASVCQPGVYDRYECTQDADCAPGLSCLLVDGDDPTSIKQCSIACQTDADCMANRQTTNGYCGRGMCHQPEAGGIGCDRDRVCESGRCDQTAKKCLDLP